jgi:teichuronic acid biosynthesis glycosyltransferase TuaC
VRILVLPKDFPSAASPQAGIFILRLAQALQALGHEIAVLRIVPWAPPITPKWRTYAATPRVENVEAIPVRTIRAFFPPRMIAMEYLPLQVQGALAREIARFRPDVLHAGFLIPNGQIAVRQNVPAVVTAHGGDAYDWPHRRAGLRRAAREAVSKATRVTAVSSYIANCVRTIADRDVEVIWNGGDERFFFPSVRAAARDALDVPQDRLVIGFAGNLLRAKGVFDLVQAAAALRDLRPLLILAGAGNDEAALRECARREGVETRFLGRIDQRGIAQLYAASDIVTLPSFAEGMPNVICEAMLCGRAVVASTAGGIPEIIESERTGLLVEPGNVAQLRDALRRVAQDEALRTRLEQTARNFAASNLTWRVSARRYDAVLRAAATECERARPNILAHTPGAS